jgi:hypothetical protein
LPSLEYKMKTDGCLDLHEKSAKIFDLMEKAFPLSPRISTCWGKLILPLLYKGQHVNFWLLAQMHPKSQKSTLVAHTTSVQHCRVEFAHCLSQVYTLGRMFHCFCHGYAESKSAKCL